MLMISSIAVYLLFYSVGYEIKPLAALFGFVTLSLAMVLPQSPGFIGTFEVIWLGIFSPLMSENNDKVLAVGILYHLVILLYNFILGIIGIFALQLSIKDILFKNKQKS